MSIPMPTKAELKRWAPRAKPEYIDAFLKLESTLEKAGILHHPLILTHFLGQVGAETNGLTIVRENMNYKTVARIRQVWPARARKTSPERLAELCNNPVALSDWAYGGRMGNRRGTTDAYDFRGAGPMQTTGRYATMKYCRKVGVPFTQDILDDVETLWLFAIHEWATTGCNSRALENDILAISKIINTGSATSGVRPNGMEHRKRWFKRAWEIWGDKKRPKVPEVSDLTLKDLKKEGSETLSASDIIKTGGIAGGVASGTAGVASESGLVETVPAVSPEKVIDDMRNATESVTVTQGFIDALKDFWLLISSNLWVIGVVLAIGGIYYARKIDWRRLIDARLGWNTHRLDDLPVVPDDVLLDDDEAVIPRG